MRRQRHKLRLPRKLGPRRGDTGSASCTVFQQAAVPLPSERVRESGVVVIFFFHPKSARCAEQMYGWRYCVKRFKDRRYCLLFNPEFRSAISEAT